MDYFAVITPLKEALEPKMTLLDAKFVPCVLMHFKWMEEDTTKQPYLKEEVYKKKTASEAASILASKYRCGLFLIIHNYFFINIITLLLIMVARNLFPFILTASC